MANPKRRHTRSRRDSRRANWKLKPSNFSKCPNCQEVKLPHQICPSCGFYNGVLVLPKKEKKKNAGQQKPEGEK